MTMSHKNYTSEFKAKVVIEVLQGEKSLSEIAAHYNLNPSMVRTWKADFIENAGVVFDNPKKAEKDARRKEAALKKERENAEKIGQLKLERDFLQDYFRQSGFPVPEIDPEAQRPVRPEAVRTFGHQPLGGVLRSKRARRRAVAPSGRDHGQDRLLAHHASGYGIEEDHQSLATGGLSSRPQADPVLDSGDADLRRVPLYFS